MTDQPPFAAILGPHGWRRCSRYARLIFAGSSTAATGARVADHPQGGVMKRDELAELAEAILNDPAAPPLAFLAAWLYLRAGRPDSLEQLVAAAQTTEAS